MPRSSLSRLLAPALVALSIAIEASGSALAGVPAAPEAPVNAVSVSAPADNDAVARNAASQSTTVQRPSIVKSVAAEWAAASKQRAQAVKVKPVRKAKTTQSVRISYHGRNHVWIPSLGVNRSVVYFSCSATGVANYVYRWGCAGRNNVYLFGHASSVFKPLHDAYARHRLSRGMRVIYADGSGRVRTYRMSFWKVVSPTNGGWAYAGQSRPSLTLQTCVGANSAYRLIVRLVQS
jgi:sortase (surface protein transpeptidase)